MYSDGHGTHKTEENFVQSAYAVGRAESLTQRDRTTESVVAETGQPAPTASSAPTIALVSTLDCARIAHNLGGGHLRHPDFPRIFGKSSKSTIFHGFSMKIDQFQ